MSDVIHLEPDGSYSFPTAPRDVPALPASRVETRIRPAVPDDYGFIDDLQKRHKHGVGFMWEKAIKGHIEKGNVLVAETMRVMSDESTVMSGNETHHCSPGTHHSDRRPVGYVLGVDRYLKRDELGIIYQMNVEPGFQRSLVAANLLKAKFERSAYGCRLYCCRCAQDLPANKFWEAMGFVPLAFRTGGGRKRGFDKDGRFRGRMHIFWQKRIREGDHGDVAKGGTAYWFPSLTGAGAIGEDRIVLPIPPGTHWSDAKPIVLPEGRAEASGGGKEVQLLESEVQRLERERRRAEKGCRSHAAERALAATAVKTGGLRFGPPETSPETVQAKRAAEAEVDAELKAAKKAVKQAKKKFDPAQEAFARELKDRWLEQVLAQPHLIAPSNERYAVARRIEGAGSASQHDAPPNETGEITATRRLDAA